MNNLFMDKCKAWSEQRPGEPYKWGYDEVTPLTTLPLPLDEQPHAALPARRGARVTGIPSPRLDACSEHHRNLWA